MRIFIRYRGSVLADLELTKDEYFIGRGSECEIRLPLEVVSRKHARLFKKDGEYFYEDLRKEHPDYEELALALDGESLIEIVDGIELVNSDYLDNEETKVISSSELRRKHHPIIGTQHRSTWTIAVSAAAGVAILAGLSILAFNLLRSWTEPSPLAAREVFEEVKPKVFEFLLRRNDKAIRDFKLYAELKDEDFREEVGYCTGFSVGPGIVLTASHCLNGSMLADVLYDVQLKSHDGKLHSIDRVLGYDIKYDYLFLESKSLAAYGFLEMSEEDFRVGRNVYTVGNVAGEGLAIREGITASKTKDNNDPSVEFIRFSAATSGGNSGGPLVDEYGRVVALVFGGNWGGNYNLGTDSEILRDAKARYVEADQQSEITIKPRRLLNFNVYGLIQAFNINLGQALYEIPEALRDFEEIEVTMPVPISLEEHSKMLIEKLNSALEQAWTRVKEKFPDDALSTPDWSSQVSEDYPVSFASQSFTELRLFPVKSQSRLFDDYLDLLLPTDPRSLETAQKSFKESRSYIFSGLTQPLTFVDDEDFHNKHPDLVLYKSQDFTSKSSLYALNGEFGSFLVISSKPEQDISQEQILDSLVGKGLLSGAYSPLIRPVSQREFSITKLEEDFELTEITDDTGRLWTRRSAQLFGFYTFDIYCLSALNGVLCLPQIYNSINPTLVKILRDRFTTSKLSHIIPPARFVEPDSLIKTLSGDMAKGMPQLNDFNLQRSREELKLGFKSLGLEVSLPDLDLIQGLSLRSAYYFKEGWKAQEVELLYGPKNKPAERSCVLGVEFMDFPVTATMTSHKSFLSGEKSGRESLAGKPEALQKYNEAVALRKKSLWIQEVKMQDTDIQIFGQCTKLRTQENNQLRYRRLYGTEKPFVLSYQAKVVN